MKLELYHVVTNGYDKPEKPKEICKESIYTVMASAVSKETARITSRYHKIYRPPERAEFSIYMDGNIGIKRPCCEIHDWAENILKDADIAICRHADRKCSYVEIEACLGRGKIDKRQAEVAHKYMSAAGHPKDFGLWECGIIVRRSAVPWVQDLQRKWWGHILCSGVHRDQLWLPMAMREANIPAGRFLTLPMNVRKNDYFTFRTHK